MTFRFTADQAMEAVADARVVYSAEEVYDRIRRMAETSHMWMTFREDRWSDELTEMLAEDGYSLRVVPRSSGNVVCVTWGPSGRKLREGVGG